MSQPISTPRTTPHLAVLSEDQIDEIHLTTLDVLENTGYKILCEEAVMLLKRAGARVDGDIVKTPRHIVEACIRSAPKGFCLYDRDGNRALELAGRNVYFGSSWASPDTRDALTSEIHPTRIEDIARGARIADALPHIDFVTPMGSAQDVPATAAELHEFEAVVTHSRKPIFSIAYSSRGLEIVYEMAARVAGGMDRLVQRPFVVNYPEPITPLVYPRESAQKLLIAAGLGMPTMGAPVTQAGLTSPVSLAGTLVMTNAETLMGLVLAQLKRPGTPHIMSGNTGSVDMATANYTVGAPEHSLMFAAYSDIVNHYGLPTWGTAGATDAKTLDQQAGLESGFSCITMALAGINLVHDLGYMDGGMVCSAEMLVMSEEAAGMARRFIRGVDVTRETLARDLIDRVGPGGNFLQAEHTHKLFRKEHWIPTLMTRQPRDAWQAQGEKTMGDRVKEKIRHILGTHDVSPLAGSVLEEISRLKREGEKELARCGRV